MMPDPDCELCGGTGETFTPAYQSAGEIIEEDMRPCLCTKKYNEEEDDSGEED